MNLKKLGSRIFNMLIVLIGVVAGHILISGIKSAGLLKTLDGKLEVIITYAVLIIFGIIFYLLSDHIKKIIYSIINAIEEELLKRPTSELFIGTGGLIIGLVIAFFLSQLINSFRFGVIGSLLSLIIYIVFPYLGLSLSIKNSKQILTVVERKGKIEPEKNSSQEGVKILDTSVIIDGRIEMISKTGFIDGTLVLPIFILEELQAIADSSNSLKRNRGRRGLDIVNSLKELTNVSIETIDRDYEDITEVDSKLVKLAKELDGALLTTDYNLNKVASIQGIQVLNINELANALKPVAIPGEVMTVEIVKKGQEEDQGLAYLDDGTMIVIDKGEEHIGYQVEAVVSSVLQTNAGKMIFADYKGRVE